MKRPTSKPRQRLLAAVGVLMLGSIAGLLGVKDEIADLWFEQITLRRYIAANFTPHVRASAAERALQPGDTFRECAKDCPEMVVIPPGEFWMGSPDGEGYRSEHPRRKIKIAKPFAVGKFEVTWDDWEACVAMRGCDGGPTSDASFGIWDQAKAYVAWLYRKVRVKIAKPFAEGKFDGRPTSDAGFGKGRHPLIYVSWDQAKAYVAWLSRMTGKPYRLLTEAEWEYAARGVTSADAPHPPYPWGDKASHEYANYGTDQCCQGKTEGRDKWLYTAPVGQFPANAFGLHDMHGNDFEWVEDPWHDDYRGSPPPPTDGSVWMEGGDVSRRVVRGGSWNNDPRDLRSAVRNWNTAGSRSNNLGFRVARTLTP